MCEVLGFVEMDVGISVHCSHHDGDFLGSNHLRIYDDDGDVLDIDDFDITKCGQCFGNTRPVPWLMLSKSTPRRFLKRGNKVVLSHK
jgi:hypothetical protein